MSAQFAEQEQITLFSSRSKSPVKITVLKNENKIIFYADNKSFYRYSLDMNYDLMNLRPVITEKTYTIGRGRTRLAAFEVKTENAAYDYSYKYSFRIHETDEEFIKDFPYLFPVGKGKTISDYYPDLNFSRKVRFENLNRTDTFFCMRKGIVSSKPGVSIATDRISSSRNAIEIIHEDGSVMVYNGADPDNIFVSVGDKVFPGQAIGLISFDYLTVDLYSILEGGKVSSKEMKFYTSGEEYVKSYDEFKDEKSEYPEEIIIKEMSSSEKRKFKKGKLF